ncbi:MAG TPA: twin-arginine translocase TatA/TatE family subunit [Bryobacteraceae bacterium]|nr:twin-arginine translocase TatA/TatE family subunit [Bryobacteraceae bacterium]
MFGGKIGLPELIVLVFIALLIFGPKKLGELGKGLGEGIKNFKSSMSDGSASTTASTTTASPTAPEEKKS